jgi:hypothetical protein
MTSMAKWVVLIVSLLWISEAQAIDPVLKCQEAKLKAQGKLQQCLKNNSAKVLGGGTDLSATCQDKFTKALFLAAVKAPCRYVDNKDGTVSDLDTGLQWEKKDNSDGFPNFHDPHDADNKYGYEIFHTGDVTVWYDFLRLLNGYSNGGTPPTLTSCFAGHCDWRLPTVDELIGIIDPTQGFCIGGSGGCIDPIFGPTQAALDIATYWSATSDYSLDPPAGFWSVDFEYGGRAKLLGWFAYVRAVRGGLGQ